MLQAEKNWLCPKNILNQKYNILFFDDLSITGYNKFHQIRNLSFRGYNQDRHTHLQIFFNWSPPYLSPSVASLRLYFDTYQNICCCVSMAVYKLTAVLHIQPVLTYLVYCTRDDTAHNTKCWLPLPVESVISCLRKVYHAFSCT